MVMCLVGPASVRLLDCGDGAESDSVTGPLADEVLRADDDEWAWIDERVVAVSDLWRQIFTGLLGDQRPARLRLIHPSWWPAARVQRLVSAVSSLAESISTAPRSQMHTDAEVFVEVGPRWVAVGGSGRQLTVQDRGSTAVDEMIGWVCRQVTESEGRISIDSPVEVPGGATLGAALTRRLRAAGRIVDTRCRIPALEPDLPPAGAGPGRRRRTVLIAGAAASVMALGGIALLFHPMRSETSLATTELVEGALAVEVPGDWPAQRVLDGPGSARVRVTSPRDAEAALHITQSRIPSADLGTTANALSTAIAAQPPGVFVDFDAAGERAGRPVVRYREVRSTHDIDWSVFVDGDLRISIGCQSARDTGAAVDVVCERAIRSAHRIAP